MTDQNLPPSEKSLKFMAWDIKQIAQALDKINENLAKLLKHLAENDLPL